MSIWEIIETKTTCYSHLSSMIDFTVYIINWPIIWPIPCSDQGMKTVQWVKSFPLKCERLQSALTLKMFLLLGKQITTITLTAHFQHTVYKLLQRWFSRETSQTRFRDICSHADHASLQYFLNWLVSPPLSRPERPFLTTESVSNALRGITAKKKIHTFFLLVQNFMYFINLRHKHIIN